MNRRLSVWGGQFWLSGKNREAARDAAQELDELGYSRLWISGGFGEGVHPIFGELLDATPRLGVASGIVSIWHAGAAEAAATVADLEQRHPGRFLLGLGASHGPLVEATAQQYIKPYSQMVDYLDALDSANPPLPASGRALAALGPRMLALAASRSAGAHPYFVPAEHTEQAREILGAGPLLAPEVAVVLERDEATARGIAREYMRGYLSLPNYSNNLRRLGWSEEDLAGGGSDRLMDALIPWGDIDSVVAGIDKHFQVGADEVPVQVLTSDASAFPAAEYRTLAAALIA